MLMIQYNYQNTTSLRLDRRICFLEYDLKKINGIIKNLNKRFFFVIYSVSFVACRISDCLAFKSVSLAKMLKLNVILSFIVFIAILHSINGEKYLPILFWHSAGETCCGKEGNLYINFLKSQLENDVYIKSVRVGKTVEQDQINSLSRHPFDQVSFQLRLLLNTLLLI